MKSNKNNEKNENNSNESSEDLSFESISSIRESIDSNQENKKIINKTDLSINNNNKLLFTDSSFIESSEKFKSVIDEEKIEIPKLLNNAIKNSKVPLLNLNINLKISKKKYNENKSLLFLKLNYNLISTYMSKGFDKKRINFQNELIELQKFKVDSEQIWVAAFDVEKNYLATGGKTGVLKIWRINSMLDDRNKYINSFIFKDKNSETVLNEEEKKSFLNIIDESIYKIYYNHSSDITDISWSKKYKNILVSVSIDCKAVIYDINQNSPLDVFIHKNALSSVCFYPDKIFLLNKFIIDKSNKNRLSSFFEESGKNKLLEIPEPKIEDDFFITACLDLKVYIWNTKRSKDPFYIIYVNEIITKALFFPDGSKLCLGSIKGNIFIYNVKDNFSYSYSFHVRNKNKKGSMKKKITDIKFIKKNEILVTTNDSRIRIININDGSVIQKFKGHKNMEGMLKCDFCENYEIIISPSEDKYVYLWNIEKKKKLDVMNDLVININNATNKEQKLSNKKVYNYEYFKPKYSERKEYCTQCLFLEGQNLINYNHKIYNNELLIYIKNIIILTTNKGNIQVLLNFNALEDK